MAVLKVCLLVNISIEANSVDTDQTAPRNILQTTKSDDLLLFLLLGLINISSVYGYVFLEMPICLIG